jgi:choline-sulfatase
VRDFLNPDRDELYHLASDPAEAKNRIRDTADPAVRAAITSLDAKLRAELRRIGDPLAAKLQ